MQQPLDPAPSSVHVLGTMTEIDDIPDMPSLRAEIDALDVELVTLLSRRSKLIDRAARIKAKEALPARIDWRVEEVVANVRRHAADTGLDADLMESIWRQIIDAAIDQENRHLKGDRT